MVIGLALILVWGRDGWFGSTEVIFSTPGMMLATIFVSLPFVVREVEPVLREEGIEQEQAARTLGANGWQVLRADHAADDPLGPDLRRDPRHGPRARRVRRGLGRLRARSPGGRRR